MNCRNLLIMDALRNSYDDILDADDNMEPLDAVGVTNNECAVTNVADNIETNAADNIETLDAVGVDNNERVVTNVLSMVTDVNELSTIIDIDADISMSMGNSIDVTGVNTSRIIIDLTELDLSVDESAVTAVKLVLESHVSQETKMHAFAGKFCFVFFSCLFILSFVLFVVLFIHT